MWLVQPDDDAAGKTPLEVVKKIIDEEAAKMVFEALHAAGYRIAVARKQWR